MKKVLIVWSVVSFTALIACGRGIPGGGDGGQPMGSGGGGGSTGVGGGGSDGGVSDGGTGGGTAMPPWVPLTFMPSCPTLTACGGDVVGSWEYTSGCISTDALIGACPTLTYTNLTGDSRGSAVFTASHVSRAASTRLSGTANVPRNCAVGGCRAVELVLARVFDTATCAADGSDGGCTCDFTDQGETVSNVPYTKATDQLTTEPGTPQARTYAYCVSGPGYTVFSYRELGTPPGDPGVYLMGKK